MHKGEMAFPHFYFKCENKITEIGLSKMENLFEKIKFKNIENVDIAIPKNVRHFRDLGIDTIGIECLNLKCEFGYLAVDDLLFGFEDFLKIF
jgi:hypothetical protein